MDERHDTPCGHAIKKLCERTYGVYSEIEYKTLSAISVNHLYNLRKSATYSRHLKSPSLRLSIPLRKSANATSCPPWISCLLPFLSAYSASTLTTALNTSTNGSPLPIAGDYLKLAISFEILDEVAHQIIDN
jgi:hypothetical protein